MITNEVIKKARQLTAFCFFVILIFWLSYLWGTGEIETAAETQMRAFSLILWSILLEAMPFVILGTIISSVIQLYVTQETILKVLPKNKFLRLIFASCIGLIFPVCECAIIPITRGLVKKGMPVGAAFAFMIATPIVNPVVLLSTYNAFPSMPQMVLYRGLFGFIGAILIGALVEIFSKKDILKEQGHEGDVSCSHGCHHCHDNHIISNQREGKTRFTKAKETVKDILAHTNEEIKSVGAYLIFGAIIAAVIQMFVPKDLLVSIGTGRISSTFTMMSMAFVLSLCSEADAFIASTFMIRFASASVLTFLITGPMIDIKNTLMLLGSFKKRFVIKLILTILIVCFVLGIAASFIMGDFYA